MKAIKKGLSVFLAAAMLLTAQPLPIAAAETADESDTSILAEIQETEALSTASETQETDAMSETGNTNAAPETSETEESTAAADMESTEESGSAAATEMLSTEEEETTEIGEMESSEETAVDETERESEEETSILLEESTAPEESTIEETLTEEIITAEKPEESVTQNDPAIESTAFEETEKTLEIQTELDGTATIKAAVVDSGILDTGLSWVLDSDGVLTISGTGDMYKNGIIYQSLPWDTYKNSIITIVVEEGVTSIGGAAFGHCSSLTNIVLPNSTTRIAWGAFMGCSSLTNITLPENISGIYEYTFSGCTSLTEIEIPDSVKAIYMDAFSGCTSLTSVTIGSGVSEIEGNVFEGCPALHNISLNDNKNFVVEDGVIFSSDKKSLVVYLSSNESKTYTVPDSVTEISYAAFGCNTSLKEVELPKNLKEIGEWAFAGTDLDEICIPAQTEKIGEDFLFGSSCSKVYVYSRNAVIMDGAFNSGMTVYGFEGSTLQEYVNRSPQWNLTFVPFSETEQPLPTGVQYVPYEVSLRDIAGYEHEADYKLIDGSLPSGMTLEKNGILTGTPAQEGTYIFTIQRRDGESVYLTTYHLEIRDNTNINVEDITDPGYELIEYVPDLYLDSLTPGGSHTLRSRGEYEEFRDVYLDGRKLQAGVDYTAESGSTRITIQDQTLTENGTGMHTIGIEFRTKDTNVLRRAAQNFTVSETSPNPGEGNTGEDSTEKPGDGTGEQPGENTGGSGEENTEENSGENTGSDQDSQEVAEDSSQTSVSYVIQRGDTLWKLAARFFGSGRYWQRIFQVNMDILRNPNRLRIGQVITIFLNSADDLPAQPDTEVTGNTYMVQPGDSLWRIASRVYGQGRLWRRIFEANRHVIADPGRIYRRQIFFIPSE